MRKVTVIIPVYNVERYIAAAIQSVLAQTHSNFELIIISDGSTDRSIEICRQFADSRIRILQQPNKGPAAARNLGVQQATGDYIAFLDGDDLWEPNKLAKHIEHLEQNPGVGVSFCRSALIDEAGNPLGIYQLVSKLAGVTILDLLCRTPIGNGSVPVMRREVFDDIQYWCTTEKSQELCYFNPDRSLHPSEDVECWLRIALTTSWKIEGVSEALTLYRVNSSGHSANLKKKLQSWEDMLTKAKVYGAEHLEEFVAPAMAYQLRHLARRAVTLRDGRVAVQMVGRSLVTYPKICLEQPRQTLETLLASLLLCLLPTNLYALFEAIAMKLVGYVQKLQILKEAVT
jgi:glycosyltransferase involved in cell wall biosynthesis